MSRAAAVAACMAAVLLAGCASLTKPPLQAGADAISGRMAVQVQGQPASSFNAAFDLRGNADRGSLALTGPLGVQVAQADWSQGQARLRARGSQHVYPDLDTLAEQALGERVPLAALFDWLRGRPWPGAPSTPTSEGFAQLGWQVNVTRAGDGVVQAQRDDPPPTVTLRARIDQP